MSSSINAEGHQDQQALLSPISICEVLLRMSLQSPAASLITRKSICKCSAPPGAPGQQHLYIRIYKKLLTDILKLLPYLINWVSLAGRFVATRGESLTLLTEFWMRKAA